MVSFEAEGPWILHLSLGHFTGCTSLEADRDRWCSIEPRLFPQYLPDTAQRHDSLYLARPPLTLVLILGLMLKLLLTLLLDDSGPQMDNGADYAT